jgi:hypothetical protein
MSPPSTRLDDIRARVDAAAPDGRKWTWKGGYPQTVLSVGDVTLIAETFENPDKPSTCAEFIAHAPEDIRYLLFLAEVGGEPKDEPDE